jgi:hypothetical protein
MPIPKPRDEEEKNDFISRCMSDPVMRDEYEQNQRLAVCYSSWRRARGEKVFSWRGLKKLLGWRKTNRIVTKWNNFEKLLEKFQKITVEEGDQYWRVRIKDPGYFAPNSLRTIDINDAGTIRAITGCPKGKFSGGRCSVGVEIQAYLFDADAFTKDQARKWVEDHM